MNKNITRVLSLVIALIMMLAVCATLASCGDKNEGSTNNNQQNQNPDNGNETPDGGEEDTSHVPQYPEIGEWDGVTKLDFTYKAGTTALGTNWNPHAWQTNADNSLLSYVTSPFVDMSILSSENGGVYQWVYEMATEVTDVTAQKQADLTKYNVKLPADKTADQVTEGYVYEIKLNPNAKWENGVEIKADDYIYSMQMLLHPKMKNYRANLYYSGESAVAGGAAYYFQGSTAWFDAMGAYAIDSLVKGEDGTYAAADGTPLMIAPKSALDWLGGNSLAAYVNAYGDSMFDVASFNALVAACNDEGYAPVTDETLALLTNVITFSPDWGETAAHACNYLVYGVEYAEADYESTVGCYKVDDYTIVYVCEQYLDRNYFMTSLTSTWLVYKPLYEAGMDKETNPDLWTTDYYTSKETTISYGTYKMDSLQDAKQVIFTQNENWYGWEKKDDGSFLKDETGNLVSFTNFVVDGNYARQYTTTKIQIDVMTEDAMKNAFLKGELSEWSPSADELSKYALSDKLIKVDETYTMSFFFNTGLETLQKLDATEKNVNSVVLNNYNFRKAMSLAIDRAEFVTATQGYKPAFSLMNSLYHYDIYNDPTSSYRNTDEAMQAICNLYGVKYGEGTPYADLKAAHDSITGFNLAEAKNLMKTACDELVAAGLYTAGQPIKIQIGWAKGALTSDDNQQVALLNKFVNAALEGSGFGQVTFEAIGNINDRYAAVPAGEYAIGYGAWGGAAFYPFRNMQVYCDTEQYAGQINETGCWDPASTSLTINIGGEDVTMTWQDWSRACSTGAYATADFATKLKITSTMEEEFLKFYYRIPLCGTTIASLLTYQMEYYTTEYNIMYGFGGLRLMSYNYDDAEWAQVVAEEGGILNYEG